MLKDSIGYSRPVCVRHRLFSIGHWFLPWMLLSLAFVFVPVTTCAQGAEPQAVVSRPASTDCSPSTGQSPRHRYDAIIVGAGIAGLSAARELQHLSRSVLILEANNRIGGRGYVGYIGDNKVPIDYGGAWIHGIPTNPLTGLVDAMGFKRQRTELELPYFVNGKQATEKEQEVFDDALEQYEDEVKLAAASIEDQYALAKFACSEYTDLSKKHVPLKEICRDLGSRIPRSETSFLRDCQRPVHSSEEFCAMAKKDLRVTSDRAKDYVPSAKKFQDIIPL